MKGVGRRICAGRRPSSACWKCAQGGWQGPTSSGEKPRVTLKMPRAQERLVLLPSRSRPAQPRSTHAHNQHFKVTCGCPSRRLDSSCTSGTLQASSRGVSTWRGSAPPSCLGTRASLSLPTPRTSRSGHCRLCPVRDALSLHPTQESRGVVTAGTGDKHHGTGHVFPSVPPPCSTRRR